MWTAVETLDLLVTGPAIEPLTIAEAKDHLRFQTTSEDHLILNWIRAARQYVEEQTGRQLTTAVWDYWLLAPPLGTLPVYPGVIPTMWRSECLPILGEIELPHPPLQTIESIRYGSVGVSPEATLDPATYQVIAPQGPTCPRGRVRLRTGSWPVLIADQPLRIRYRAGYGDTKADVPALLRTAMLLLLGHFHQHRAEVYEGRGVPTQLPLGVEVILRGFKYAAFPMTQARRFA